MWNRLKPIQNLQSSQVRFTCVCALLGAVVVGLWPDHARPVDPAKTIAVTLAAIAWIFVEIASAQKPRQHDIDFHGRITGVLTDDVLYFLRNQDFLCSLDRNEINPIGIISSWHGSRYEFLDIKIQKKWSNFVKQITKLDRLFGEHLNPNDRGNRLSTMFDVKDEWNIPKNIIDAVTELNDLASRIYHDFNEFDKYARNRLNL